MLSEPDYIPTREEIERKCKEIQAEWDDATRLARYMASRILDKKGMVRSGLKPGEGSYSKKGKKKPAKHK